MNGRDTVEAGRAWVMNGKDSGGRESMGDEWEGHSGGRESMGDEWN